ncbi:MAG: four helix bundle protein [Candidatus Kapabacteria bacterium]|nr:four helix bundle protein [Candidatus Kapabacteria bacterium]
MSLTQLRIYQRAGEISDEVALFASLWPLIHRNTIGDQIIRAADSVSNNIAEGYGRTATGERIQFLMYADGSIAETRNCLKRALVRGLIASETNAKLQQSLLSLSISIVEFANAILEKDEYYNGPFRKRIAKRRAWLVEKLAKNADAASKESSIRGA